jgi:hypothetical protein
MWRCIHPVGYSNLERFESGRFSDESEGRKQQASTSHRLSDREVPDFDFASLFHPDLDALARIGYPEGKRVGPS